MLKVRDHAITIYTQPSTVRGLASPTTATAPQTCALYPVEGWLEVAGGWGQNQWNKWGKHSTCDTFQNTICRTQTVSTIELQNSTSTAFIAFKQYVDQVLWYCEVAEELLILCCPSNEVPPSSAPQNCCH